jgi:uncharacterized protein (TIGR02145 family)
MKHTLKNPANLLTMSIMVAAMALAFLACEEKSKKADTPKTEKDCPYKEIGALITAEAELVSSGCAALDCGASFRLANGEEISLLLPDGISIVQDLIGTNDKASITYQRIQRLMDTYGPDDEDGGITVVKECYERDVLKSVEMKAKATAEISEGNTFTDTRDGKIYKSVKIGKQTWMAENLNYKTGDSYCYNDNEANCKKYGRLYDWNTAVKACPSGWHLPSSEEWNKLLETAGGKDVAGKKLKSKTGWDDNKSKSGNGTDEFGFSAMPGGYRYYSIIGEGFDFIGYQSIWWSATESDGESRYEEWNIESSRDSMNNNSNNNETGFSVRCVQD